MNKAPIKEFEPRSRGRIESQGLLQRHCRGRNYGLEGRRSLVGEARVVIPVVVGSSTISHNQRIKSPLLYLLPKVIPKDLWIDQVIHALTVTKAWVVHALTVTTSRINGHHTIYSLYLPIVKTPVVGASPYGDKSATCPPTGLHLLPTAIF